LLRNNDISSHMHVFGGLAADNVLEHLASD